MESVPREIRFRFDQYEVDLSAAELRRNGRRVPIQDKPLRLLAYLSHRAGQVVTRREIQEHLWPPDTTVVFEDGLNTAVKKLREALNDDPEKPRYIETVRRRGYRFLGEVQAVPHLTIEADSIPPLQEASVQTSSPASLLPLPVSAPRTRFTAIWPTAAAVICLFAVGLTFRHYRKVVSASVETPHPHAIAVLPIANLTGDPRRDYLCDGVTEEIIARLGEEDPSSLRVIARTSAMSFRNTTMTARQIGDALGVDYLLEGTLQGDGDHLRLIERMVRSSDQSQLWTQTYLGGVSQLQEIESTIADRSAQSVPGAHPLHSGAAPFVVSGEAHDLYLQGLYSLAQRRRTAFDSALLSFGEAIQKEPRYAQAYAQLAVTYNLMGQYDWMRQEQARSQGRAAALQALAITPDLVEAKAALGFSYWFYDWDSIRGESELASAVEHDPNNVDAHHWLAMVLMTNGQTQRAEEQMHEALALDPRSLILNTNLGWVHYMGRRYTQALQELTAVETQSPMFSTAHHKLQPVAYMLGDKQRAWDELYAQLQITSTPEFTDRIARVYARDGYTAAMKALVTTPGDNVFYSNPAEDALDYMFAGDRDGALQSLQLGLRNHDGWMVFIAADPAFEPLHKDPAYQRIMERVRSAPQDNQDPVHPLTTASKPSNGS